MTPSRNEVASGPGLQKDQQPVEGPAMGLNASSNIAGKPHASHPQVLVPSTEIGSLPLHNHYVQIEQSFVQQYVWSFYQLHSDLAWYTIPCAVRLRGPLQRDALNTAIDSVRCRHSSLRTTFTSLGGTNFQGIHPFESKKLCIVDISSHDEHELHYRLQQQRDPFNLEAEPGWRTCLYRFHEEDYVLSIVMHHIISDRWSPAVLLGEIASFYSIAVQGLELDLLSEVQHAPDTRTEPGQHGRLEMHQQQLKYWATQLAGSRPAELLHDNPRPALLSGRAEKYSFRIEGQVYNLLQRFCKLQKVESSIVLLTAFRAAHYRLTRASDATVGTIDINRGQSDVIGRVPTIQCLRIKVDGESFLELARQVQTTKVASAVNNDVPFERIVSTMQQEKDLSRHPLVQLALIFYSRVNQDKYAFSGIDTELVATPVTTRFDVELHFFREDHDFRVEVIYSTDLYKVSTIENMLEVVHRILLHGLAEPLTPILSLPLMTADDYAKLDSMGILRTHTTNCSPTSSSPTSSIIEVFQQQVAVTPDKVAVKDSTSRLTYAELDYASGVVGRWLSNQGSPPETLIGVLATRSCQTVTAFLGILKANLAYLPLDVRNPTGRIDTILACAPKCKLVLHGAHVQPPALQRDDVEFEKIANILNGPFKDRNDLQCPTDAAKPIAGSLAYVMFTSGSTGRPKGVMVEHRCILRLVKHNNMVQYLPEACTMAHMSNIAFDVSTWEIYATLLNGGTLICIDVETMLEPGALGEAFIRDGVQAATFTPALLKQQLNGPGTIGALNTIIVTGDRASAGDLFSARKLTGATVLNAYGPTENTVTSTIFCLPDGESCTNGVPIGRTLDNSGAHVMDHKQRLVPLGVIGELVVTGVGLARGYTDPQLDANRFIWVNVGDRHVRAYRTGDLARCRPRDGHLEFFGRMDGQVKIRGHRVELAEVEHNIRSHESVDDAVVVSRNEGDEATRLLGFITLRAWNNVIDKRQKDDHEVQVVQQWSDRYDTETYTPMDNIRHETVGRDFVGWTSMYNGRDIDVGEMHEWLQDTISTIRNMAPLGRVLEVGSGSGMILFNLGDGLQSYVGLEPSQRALDFTTKAANSIPTLAGKVTIHKATAADIGQLDTKLSADLAILNSVVQHFPSQAYLLRVVQDLLRLEGIQRLFFGDIRSYALHRQFLVMRALYIAGEDATKDVIRRIINDLERAEAELLVDPGFFTALPTLLPGQIEHVQILPKKMSISNELSCYRYAAVVYVKNQGIHRQSRHQTILDDNPLEWVDFREQGLDRRSLLGLLRNSSDSTIIAVGNIPNSNIALENHLLDSLNSQGDLASTYNNWVSSARERANSCPSLSTTDLLELAEEANWRLELSWARQYSQRGGLDAIFYRFQPRRAESMVKFRFPADHHGRQLHLLSSEPLRQRMKTVIQKELQEKLQTQLPSYMIPQSITVLDDMPVNENGKVDRAVLVESAQFQPTVQGTIEKPATEVERQLQMIWSEVLRIDTSAIRLDTSFFQLGGDSISAIRVVTAGRELGIDIAVADIFRYPSLHELACRASYSRMS